MKSTLLIIPLCLTLAACHSGNQQQARAMRKATLQNRQYAREASARHEQERDTRFADFRNKLAQARSAVYMRQRGDCCCTGAELPPVGKVALSAAEFQELMSILSLATAPPLMNEAHILTPYEARARQTADGSWQVEKEERLVASITPPPPVDQLRLLDARGKALVSIAIGNGLDKISRQEKYTHAIWERNYLHALLPDEAFTRYENLPSRQKFLKLCDRVGH